MPKTKELATESVKQKRDIVQLWEIGHETTVYVTTKSGSVYLLKRGSSADNFTLKKPDGQSPFFFQETPLGDPIVKGNSIIGGRGEISLGNTSEITEIEIENPEADEITPRIREIAEQYAPSQANKIQNDVSAEASATGAVQAEPKEDSASLRFRIRDMFYRIQEIDFTSLTLAEFTNMIGTINTYLHDNLPTHRSSIIASDYRMRTETIRLKDGAITISFSQIYTTVQGEIKLTPSK